MYFAQDPKTGDTWCVPLDIDAFREMQGQGLTIISDGPDNPVCVDSIPIPSPAVTPLYLLEKEDADGDVQDRS